MPDDFDRYLQERRAQAADERRAFWLDFGEALLTLGIGWGGAMVLLFYGEPIARASGLAP